MRSILRRTTAFGIVVALCALPLAAAPASGAVDEVSWDGGFVERLIDTVAELLGIGDEKDEGKGTDGFGDGDNQHSSPPCPPGQSSGCEGGPDWDPNG